MKIVILSSSSFADSDFPLIRELKKQGHEIYYFMDLPCYGLHSTLIDIDKQIPETSIFGAYKYNELSFFKEYLGIEHFYVVNRTQSSVFKLSNIKVKRKLHKIIKEINPDVIHYIENLDILDWPLLFSKRKKMVVTIHDPFPHTGSGSFRSRLNRLLTLRLIKKIVLLNGTLADKFKAHWGLKDKNVLITKMGPFNWIELFKTESSAERNLSPIVLFYGRISPYKGIEYLCEAMERVHKVIPEAKLIIAGSGKMYFDFSKYENLDYIEFINKYISIQDIASLLDMCIVNVLPYTDATQSGVVLTSFAMNKPVIATNVGAMSEYIENGVTGILVPPRRSDLLSEAIISYLEDSTNSRKFGKNIEDKKMDEFDGWNGIVNKYTDFYRL